MEFQERSMIQSFENSSDMAIRPLKFDIKGVGWLQ